MSWYVGIDTGSNFAGLAGIKNDGTIRHQVIHPTGDFPNRFVQIREHTRHWLQQIADDGCSLVVIERPVARGTKNSGTLLGAYGVIVESVRSMLDAPIEILASAQWKRIACGHGAAQPDRVFSTAAGLGYGGKSMDAAVAVCCAEAARILDGDPSKLRAAA